MSTPISSHFSFIVRCWRDTNGTLRGWVVDALTQRTYPFVTEREMTKRINSLTQDLEQEPVPESTRRENQKGESHAKP